MAGIALILLGLCTVCTAGSICHKEEIEASPEVVWKPQVVKSQPINNPEINPEVKTISKDQDVIEKATEPMIEVMEDVVIFSESEKIAMGKTVYKEARGECEKGRIAIVAVILNRWESRRAEYGAENGDIMEVITYPNAFAYPKDMTDEYFINCPEYESCMKAVEAAINGYDPTEEYFPEGACHFYSLVEPLSEQAQANREGIDIYVIGNQAFHNDMN